MNKDDLFEKIAKEKLGIDVLHTRKSDRLDFHDIPVWEIKAALEAAYEEGKKELAEELSKLKTEMGWEREARQIERERNPGWEGMGR